MTRDMMIPATADACGKRYERPYEVSIWTPTATIASVLVFSSAYMNYLHIARSGADWLLLNVLWQRRPSR